MVGTALKSRRLEHGVSQTLLAKVAGWSQGYTSRLEARSREVSLAKAERYLSALQSAAALAAQARDEHARAEAELLARFEGNNAHAATPPPVSGSAAPSLIKNEPPPDPYAAAVKKLTAKYGPPTRLKSGELFWSLPDKGLVLSSTGWRTTYKGQVLAHGDFDALEGLVRL